ncbi:MAG: DUF4272 domain-containing protein [Bacilli bacterium]
MSEASLRKLQSIELLKQFGIPFIEHLPVVETVNEVNARSVEEIAKRAIACLVSIQHACDAINENADIKESREMFLQLLHRYDVHTNLTPNEQAVFAGVTNESQNIQVIWQYERYWVLVWALGLVEELEYPLTTCDCPHAIQLVSTCADFGSFLDKCRLRPMEEILDQFDLHYRLDWAVKNARINGEATPGNLDASVVYERHCAFVWLMNEEENNDWDHIAAHT